MTTLEQKVAFAQKAQNAANMGAQFYDLISDLQKVYLDRKWQPGGQDVITDEDLAGLGITAAQLSGLLQTFYARFAQLMTAQAVSGTIDGDAILNAVRSDV